MEAIPRGMLTISQRTAKEEIPCRIISTKAEATSTNILLSVGAAHLHEIWGLHNHHRILRELPEEEEEEEDMGRAIDRSTLDLDTLIEGARAR